MHPAQRVGLNLLFFGSCLADHRRRSHGWSTDNAQDGRSNPICYIFVIFGGNYSGQLEMLLALIACSLGSFAGLVSWLAASNFQMIFSLTANLITFAVISFCSGALWSVDFSF